MENKTFYGGGAILNERMQRWKWDTFIQAATYTIADRDRVIDGLIAAQKEEFDSLLPDDCGWEPSAGCIYGPADAEIGDIQQLMREACDAVSRRYDEIERVALKG